MTGRPTDFTQDIANAICERLADGQSLRSICGNEDMPGQTTVFRWLNDNEDFREQYTRSREVQADTLFDEILDIADDGRNDWIEKHDQDGGAAGYRENGEAIRRSQLRIDARKWMAGKLRPKKYGEKLDIQHSGSIQQLSDEEVDARIAALVAEAGAASAAGGKGPQEADEQA